MKHPITVFLKPRIKEFLAKKGESLRWFAKQTNVDYQKLYRLEAQELRSLSFFEANRILKVIEPKDCANYLREFYPDEFNDISGLDLSDLELQNKSEAVDLILSSQHGYEVYLFATESKGATFAIIEKYYGLKGLEILNQFVAKGALTPTPNGFIGILDGNNAVHDEQSRAICKTQVDSVDFGLPGSFIGTHSKGLNLEGKKIVYKAVADLSRLIFATIENPEYQGDDTVVASVFCGSIRGQQ